MCWGVSCPVGWWAGIMVTISMGGARAGIAQVWCPPADVPTSEPTTTIPRWTYKRASAWMSSSSTQMEGITSTSKI